MLEIKNKLRNLKALIERGGEPEYQMIALIDEIVRDLEELEDVE